MSTRKIWTRVGLSGLTLVGLLAVLVLYMGWHQKVPRDVAAPAAVNEVTSPSVASGPPVVALPPSKNERGDQGSGRSPASVDQDDEQIDAELARLKQGHLAYNTPQKMKTGKTARVVARIGSDAVALRALTEGMSSEEGRQTGTAATPVSTKMKMTLKSADFDITALSSEEQIVGGDAPTTWEWDITPKHSGNLGLHLAAVVELHNLARDFTTVDREIAVAVDPVAATEDFLKANTVWVLGLIGAGGTAVWTWLRKRKKPEAARWQTP